MDLGGAGWAIMTIIGPLVLLAVIAWAALRNRSSNRTKDESERATHDLYDAEDRVHRNEDNDVP